LAVDVTREELWAQVHQARDRFYAGNPLYQAATPPPKPVCASCEGAGTVTIALGPIDRLSGQPDDTIEVPCPMCPAGDAEAEHRIGRPWR
jgi:hypothetical protein